jgi:aquaporin Z
VATRKYVTEFIGAFFLTFAVGVAALTGSVFVPLAAGATLMVMIYAGGHISGGHYNPAVTLAALVRRRIGIRDAVPYWIAQVIGGVVAGVIARAVVNPATVKTLHLSGHTEAAAAVVELLITFALCYVVLNVSETDATQSWLICARPVDCERPLMPMSGNCASEYLCTGLYASARGR